MLDSQRSLRRHAWGVMALVLAGGLGIGAGAGAAPDAGAPAAADETKAPPTLFELLEKGGPVMYPIYAASVLALAFAIERAISLRRRRVLPRDFVQSLRLLVARQPIQRDEILSCCATNATPAARILGAAVKRLHRPLPEVEKAIEDAGAKEARLLRRNTRVLSAVASLAPLLGLLGTVFGMISAFQEISVGQALGKAELLASGIYEALVTTAAGLTIAIPSLVLYLVLNAKIERLVAELDDLALEFVEAIALPEPSPAAAARTDA